MDTYRFPVIAAITAIFTLPLLVAIALVVGSENGRALDNMIHVTGVFSVWILMFCIASSPLAALAEPWPDLKRIALDLRILEVALLAAFMPAHVILFVIEKSDWEVVTLSAFQPRFVFGWLAFGILLPILAAAAGTAVRRGNRARPWMDTALWGGAVVVTAHWWLSKGQAAPLIALQLAPFVVLEGLRLRKILATRT